MFNHVEFVFIIHMISCFILTGLIWTVQLVHYPSFRFISPNKFKEFSIFHSRSITYIVAPLMCLELATAFLVLIFYKNVLGIVAAINLIGVLGAWFSTFLLSVPIHLKLSSGYDLKQIRLLVLTNWPRTFMWTFRSLIFIFVLIDGAV